jgi:hypothetical protein
MAALRVGACGRCLLPPYLSAYIWDCFYICLGADAPGHTLVLCVWLEPREMHLEEGLPT